MTGLDVLRRAVDRFNARDVDGFVELCDPDIECTPLFARLLGEPYRGHAGVRQWMEQIDELWERFGLDTREMLEHGDHLVAVYTLRGRGRASGADVETELVLLAKERAGRLTWFEVYENREEAFRVAGLTPGPA